eukprot:TRINITY_DN5164_c0_g1_i3.p2 TRINITY_DN5164_c0_g1~~TRINITY_DN5164_c0_g1_i3.p2  ORF type:complete len:128 (-),score=26.93 TRINITY_DN5164_c0_g1_i3:8-391(-)
MCEGYGSTWCSIMNEPSLNVQMVHQLYQVPMRDSTTFVEADPSFWLHRPLTKAEMVILNNSVGPLVALGEKVDSELRPKYSALAKERLVASLRAAYEKVLPSLDAAASSAVLDEARLHNAVSARQLE